ncbi:MAG: thiosulfate oxidation carrier protein SoxY [Thiomargarita sp.]|nr:thiosulfate oxidation carrier protein SoxY [Thiomargarita sp.]
MSLPRRDFLKGIIATSGVMALGTILIPEILMAKEWPKDAFYAEKVEDVLLKLFEDADPAKSNQIIIEAPEIAENGAVVPIEVTAPFTNVDSITIIGDQNPTPLIAQFNFEDNAEAWIKTRIKLGKTSNVVAVVKAEGKFYIAQRHVKVTIGGCGG